LLNGFEIMATSGSLARPLRLALGVLLVCWLAQYVHVVVVPRGTSAARLRVQHQASVELSKETGEPTDNLDRCATHRSHEVSSFLDYEQIVYCTRLGDSLALARTVLVVILVVLLYLLSSTADSFFCPVLQVIPMYCYPFTVTGHLH
jgi:hypothetical protein